MADGHEQFESLAVSHVLGGLDQETASAFRRHLVGCLQCKAQVAELRALAGSLEDAAREERAVLALQTRARREVSTDDDLPEAIPPPLPRRVLIAVVLVVVALAALMAHNLHLQSREATLAEGVAQRSDVLSGLARGLAMDTEFSQSATGMVVANGDEVSWTVSGLPVPTSDQQVVVWLVEPDAQNRAARYGATAMPEGEISGMTDDDGARELVVTLEDVVDGETASEPTGPEFARADLSPIRETDDRNRVTASE